MYHMPYLEVKIKIYRKTIEAAFKKVEIPFQWNIFSVPNVGKCRKVLTDRDLFLVLRYFNVLISYFTRLYINVILDSPCVVSFSHYPIRKSRDGFSYFVSWSKLL